jgi:hypothetical protein
MSFSRFPIQFIMLFAMLVILAGMACVQKNPLDSTESIIGNMPNLVNMKAQPTKVAAGGGISAIEVTLLSPEDKPMEGGVVTFSLAGEGRLDTTRATTNSKGIASINFYSGTKAAQSKIIAAYGSSVKEVVVSVISAASGEAIILISSSRSFLYANGVDSAQINIQVIPDDSVDAAYQPVYLNATFGSVPANRVLDKEGKATATFRSDTSGTDIQAQISAQFGNLSANTAIPVKAVSFDLSVDIPMLPADGKSTCKITAIIKQKGNGKPINNASLTFSATTGTIQNENRTGADGKAIVTLTSTSTPDTATVTAWYGDLSDSLKVIFYSNNISDDRSRIKWISAEKPEIWANPTFQDGVTVEVMDADGLPKANATVYFESSAGLLSHKQVQTDAEGKAVVYISGYESDFDSTATIKADLYNGTPPAEISILLKSESYKPRYIEIKFDPPSIGVVETGQVSTTNVLAYVKDTKYRLVRDNIRVFFDIIEEPGGVTITTVTNQGVPTVEGVAKISCSAGIRSGTVRMRARLIDDPLTEEDESLIEVESTKLIIHAGPPFMADRNDPNTSHLSVVTRRLNIWEGQDTTMVSVIVGDKYKNPADHGTAVYLTATGGVVTTQSFTNQNGIAKDTLFAGSPTPTVNRYHGYDLILYDASVGGFNAGGDFVPQFLGTMPPLEYGGDYIWNPNYDADNNLFHTIQYIPGSCFDYEFGEVPNTNTIDFWDDNAWDMVENDGISRVRASTIGVDANNDSIYVWNWTEVIFSGHIQVPTVTATGHFIPGFRENSRDVIAARDEVKRQEYINMISYIKNRFVIPPGLTDADLYDLCFPDGCGHRLFYGESMTIIIRIYDHHGNPIHCGSLVTAQLSSSAPLGLSWMTRDNPAGTGTTIHTLTVSNEVNLERPKPGGAAIDITVKYYGGKPALQTAPFRAEAAYPDEYIEQRLSSFFNYNFSY